MGNRINTKALDIIGSTEYIDVAGIKHVPAKIDTGADTSAIWASQINIDEDGVLTFVLFDEKSPLYTGEILSFTDYVVRTIRSSHGDKQIRYRVELPITICGKSLRTIFTLANRSRNNFPILIGRRTLDGIFLVDVSKSSIKRHFSGTPNLNHKLKEDPYKFHQKYYKNQKGIR